jgi:hypothetical protein
LIYLLALQQLSARASQQGDLFYAPLASELPFFAAVSTTARSP